MNSNCASLDRCVDAGAIFSRHQGAQSSHGTERRDRPTGAVAHNANTALGRIEIPQDAVEQISELLTPGSSLIISDYGISSETGEDTDFIVVTH